MVAGFSILVGFKKLRKLKDICNAGKEVSCDKGDSDFVPLNSSRIHKKSTVGLMSGNYGFVLNDVVYSRQ